MANYWMQLIHVAEVSDHWSVEEERHGDFLNLQQKTYRPVEGVPAQPLSAGNLDEAKKEAAEHWEFRPNEVRLEGYWIVEAQSGCQFVYDHAETVERQLAKARSF
jgi:uncharacterized protein YcaQ